MIDPIHSLAFSVQANRGVYALLVGSGVSRAAEIPTGWEVTLDLIRKLAGLYNETCDPDPELWYREKFGSDANYSDLLDGLAKTPAERQQLLREYFEPNDQEREEGKKEPTAAHRAIAALVKQGFTRVIITTNFDRLLETALNSEGIVPTIVSSPDQIQGALPLIHTQCCVFKVHGDYLDTRIRNTPAELEQYPPEYDQLLDRIFDEFGLIVCGWSAEWDGALRSALTRAPSRRFTTYWAVRGKPGDEAQRLISHRRAQVIPIEDADSFFQTVQQYVESIEEFSRPHPLSTEAAVASLKRYISEPRHEVRLSDLVDETVKQVVEVTSSEAFALTADPDGESATTRLKRYEEVCSTLIAMALVGGFWAKEEHHHVWRRALERLDLKSWSGVSSLWLQLHRYPSTLLLYALGLSAVEASQLQFLNYLLTTPILRHKDQKYVPAVRLLLLSRFLHEGMTRERLRKEGLVNSHDLPRDKWIYEPLWPYAERIIPDKGRYTLVFDRLEILMALSSAYQDKEGLESYYLGSFVYRSENRNRIRQEIEGSPSAEGNESPFVTCGIFGRSAEECKQGLVGLEERLGRW
ncbi:MAG: SIR2 family protein [Truepera sp.]|nr:SIR2 family protein [Truepera sp.]